MAAPIRRGQLGWGAVGLMAAAHFSAFADRALPAMAAPLIKAEMGVSDAAIGVLQGPAFVVLYVVVMLLAGHLVTRFDPWLVAAACLATWTVGGLVFALAESFAGMIAGRALLGAGQAAFPPAALMLLGAQAEPGRRSRALSMFTTGSATGRSGALLIGGGLLAVLGGGAVFGLAPWRAVCLALVAPNLIILVLLLLRARAGVGGGQRSPGGLGAALRAIRRQPAAFLSVAAAGAGAVLLVQAAGAWAPSILNRSFALDPAAAAVVFGLIVLTCAPLGHLSAGWLLAHRRGRRIGPGFLLAAAVLVAAAAAGGLSLTADPRLGGLLLGVLTAAGGLAAVTTLITVQAISDAPLRPATGALFMVTTTLVGVGGGPWMTGLLSDTLAADGQALARALGLLIAPVALVVAATGLAGDRAWRRCGG